MNSPLIFPEDYADINRKVISFIYHLDKKKFLAIRMLHNDKLSWYTVNGDVNRGEAYEQAATRKVVEETNLKVVDSMFLNWGGLYSFERQTKEEHYFIIFVRGDKLVLDEGKSAKWLGLANYIESLNFEADKEEFEVILKKAIHKEICFPYIRLDDFTLQNKHQTIFKELGKSTIVNWVEDKDFEGLQSVKQMHVLCFNKKGEILLVSNKKDFWTIPVSAPEKNESFDYTLKRKIYEELGIEVEKFVPLGYNLVDQSREDGREIFYQLRYLTKIKEINKIKKKDMLWKIKFVKPKEFLKNTLWGRTGKKFVEAAVAEFKKAQKH